MSSICVMCGNKIPKEDVSIPDANGKEWCTDCAGRTLARFAELEGTENLPEKLAKYETAWPEVIGLLIQDETCAHPEKVCYGQEEECRQCWDEKLLGGKEG